MFCSYISVCHKNLNQKGYLTYSLKHFPHSKKTLFIEVLVPPLQKPSMAIDQKPGCLVEATLSNICTKRKETFSPQDFTGNRAPFSSPLEIYPRKTYYGLDSNDPWIHRMYTYNILAGSIWTNMKTQWVPDLTKSVVHH